MEVFVAVFVAVIISALIIALSTRSGELREIDNLSPKARNALIRDCSRRLARDPRNVRALTALADLYYNEQNWEKAFSFYRPLFEIKDTHVEIDAGKCATRMGICAFKINKLTEAGEGLNEAHNLMPHNYEVNFYLGQLMYKTGEYEKAVTCLRHAAVIKPDSNELNLPLGMSYFKSSHYRDALPFLRRVHDDEPANKEVLFTLGETLDETGDKEQALQIFTRLRPDPQYGAQSCLAAGKIHENEKKYDLAQQDYEIGLKLENTPPDVLATLHYRLALCYIELNNIGQALFHLRQIQLIMPDFNGVNALVQKYEELNSNTNLQTYLLSPTSDFVALCRRFVGAYHPDATVMVEDITSAADYTDILCEVETSKWENVELFRFYRSGSSIGELSVRDFHSKLQDMKCDRGFCVAAGTFSEEAQRYCEGRPVDLIEKSRLTAILKNL